MLFFVLMTRSQVATNWLPAAALNPLTLAMIGTGEWIISSINSVHFSNTLRCIICPLSMKNSFKLCPAEKNELAADRTVHRNFHLVCCGKTEPHHMNGKLQNFNIFVYFFWKTVADIWIKKTINKKTMISNNTYARVKHMIKVNVCVCCQICLNSSEVGSNVLDTFSKQLFLSLSLDIKKWDKTNEMRSDLCFFFESTNVQFSIEITNIGEITW